MPWDVAAHYGQELANEEVNYREKTDMVGQGEFETLVAFLPLTDEDLDEYEETGKFSRDVLRDALQRLADKDKSGNLARLF